MTRAWTELRFLFVTQLLEERGWWFGTLTVSALFPLLLVFGMSRVGGARSPEELAYVVTGTVVVSLTTMGVTVLAQGRAGALDSCRRPGIVDEPRRRSRSGLDRAPALLGRRDQAASRGGLGGGAIGCPAIASPARSGLGEPSAWVIVGLRIADRAGLPVETSAPGWWLVVAPLSGWPGRLARGALPVAWVAALLAAVVLLWLGVAARRFARDLACPPCDQDQVRLVSRAFAALGAWELLAGAVLLLYLLSLLRRPVRDFYLGGRPLAVHVGWGAAAFGWVLYAGIDSLFGIAGDQRLELLRLLPPLVLAVACFLFGTAWSGRSSQRLTWLTPTLAMAAGFLLLACMDLVTLRETNGVTDRLQAAFRALHQAGTGVPAEHQRTLKTGGLDLLATNAQWLVLGAAYLLTARTSRDLPAFVRGCPFGWISRNLPGPTAHALLPVAGAAGLFLSGALARSIAPALGTPGETQTARSVTGLLIVLLPAYVALGLTAAGYGCGMASSRWGGWSVDGARRRTWLDLSRPAMLVVFLIAGVWWGNAFVLGHLYNAPGSDSLRVWLAGAVPSAATDPVFWRFVLVALVAVAVHYSLLVELPYWWGQRRWREAEVARTRGELRSASADLRRQLGYATSTNVLAVVQSQQYLLRGGMRYWLAQDGSRAAREIPVHTFRSIGDFGRKAANAVLLAFATAALGYKTSAASGAEAIQGIVRAALGALLGS